MSDMRTVKKNAVSSKTTRGPPTLNGREGETATPTPPRRKRNATPVLLPKAVAPGTTASAFRAASGITTNTSELVATITDYVDYNSTASSTSAIRSYLQNVKTNIFKSFEDPDKPLSNPGCVFKKLVVHALPQAANGAVAAKTFLFQGGVLAADTNLDNAATNKRLLGTVNTVVKTDFNVQWIHVGTFDYDKIFKDSNVTPLLYEVGADATDAYQDLLRYAIIDPDSGNAFADNNSVRVQLRFQLVVSHLIAPTNQTPVISTVTTNWSEPLTNLQTSDIERTFVTIKLDKLTNVR